MYMYVCVCVCAPYLDVLERGVYDFIVVRETIELECLKVEIDMMVDLQPLRQNIDRQTQTVTIKGCIQCGMADFS